MSKHDLRMRPVYHWTPARIKAHILICFMAYTIAARVRYKLKKKGVKLSVRALRKELSYIQASIIKDKKSGRRYLLPSALNKSQKDVLAALDVKIDTSSRQI